MKKTANVFRNCFLFAAAFIAGSAQVSRADVSFKEMATAIDQGDIQKIKDFLAKGAGPNLAITQERL